MKIWKYKFSSWTTGMRGRGVLVRHEEELGGCEMW